jgi:hypothetical protein
MGLERRSIPNHRLPGPLIALAVVAVAGTLIQVMGASSSAPGATGHPLLVGLYDQGQTLYGNPAQTFSTFRALHVQVLRLDLDWGGSASVARVRPINPTDPSDPSYDWSVYDRSALLASQYGIQLLFVIVGTPAWENGGAGWNRAPRNMDDLRNFALAAATRYSGHWLASSGQKLPAVHFWAAWNEPNNPVFLAPQYRRVRSRWVMQSAADYAHICAAVYSGVHAARVAGDEVGCGLTAPRGNNRPTGSRPSTAPLAFVNAVHAVGLKRFDAWAHHPYAVSPTQTPTSKPRDANAITFGNLPTLIDAVTRDWGPKPIWITEYGYQTNPPDPFFGVSWTNQARYLTQSFAIARRNPRVQLMIWFLLRDEPNISGWQSGLETVTGRHKPSYAAYQHLPH